MKFHRKNRIRDWGGPKRLKNFRKFLRRISQPVIAAVLFFCAFVFIFFALINLRNLIRNQIIQNLAVSISRVSQLTAPSPNISQNLPPSSGGQPAASVGGWQTNPLIGLTPAPVYFSFSDLFSGTGWLNVASTTMYQDKKESAFLLPPVFSWRKTGGSVSATGFVNRASDGSLTKCIARDCLMVVNNDLFFNGIKLINPNELSGSNISSVSIGSLTTKWVIGFVVSRASSYEAHLFFFDGKNFSQVSAAGSLFASKYLGVFGFGGNDNEWLAVYGAYEGNAYKFSKAGNGYQIQDISKFFDIRVDAGGFEPSVIGPVIVDSGFGPVENWYIWSLTRNGPTLVKVFGKIGDNLTGAVDFRDEILPGAPSSALFKFNSYSKDSITLDALVTDENGNQAMYQFTDLGFDRSKQYAIFSSNISSYPWPVSSVKISSAGLNINDAQVNFYVSSNTSDWLTVDLDKNQPMHQGRPGLFWMTEVKPGGDNWLSPFFDYIRIDMEIIPT